MPEFAVLFVMKAKNAIKTSDWIDYLLVGIVKYDNKKINQILVFESFESWNRILIANFEFKPFILIKCR